MRKLRSIKILFFSLSAALLLVQKDSLAQSQVLNSASSNSIDQLTKDLIIAKQRHDKSSGLQKEELAESMRRIARERTSLLEAALLSDPQAILEAKISKSVYDSMPYEIRKDMEQEVQVEGVIEPSAFSKSTGFPYRLRDRQGRTLRLFCVGEKPVFSEGGSVRINGIQFKDALIFSGSGEKGLQAISRTGTDTDAPRVTIESPRQGDTLRGQIRLKASASDNKYVTQLHFLKDQRPIASLRQPPYEAVWDTKREPDGPHIISARAEDADMNIGIADNITVTVDNTPPKIELKSPKENDTVSASVKMFADAADVIGVELVKFLIDGNPIGVSMSAPYETTWDIAPLPNGFHIAQALAVDRAGNSTLSEPVSIRVMNANRSPILKPIGSKTVEEETALTFTVNASDPDGERDRLSFTAKNLPSWASFDENLHQFNGIPDFSVASFREPEKLYEKIQFKVCDPQPMCDSEEINIIVKNVNRTPVINPIGNITSQEGQPFSVTAVSSDPDDDELRCRIELAPPWATADTSKCSISGTPGFDAASQDIPIKGYRGVTFQVCDTSEKCAKQNFDVIVTNVNRPPRLERIGDKTVDEGKKLSFMITAKDPDEDSINLTLVGRPDGSSFYLYEDKRGAFSWTPGFDQAGSYRITVTASDNKSEEYENVIISVRQIKRVISGKIRDDMLNPLSKAKVSIAKTGETAREILTDDNGYYTTGDLSPGRYTIRPSFSTSLGSPTSVIVHFNPLSRIVDITNNDQPGIDFSALRQE